MSENLFTIHVLMRIKDLACEFEDKFYPEYIVGFKKGDEFWDCDGKRISIDDIEHWKAV